MLAGADLSLVHGMKLFFNATVLAVRLLSMPTKLLSTRLLGSLSPPTTVELWTKRLFRRTHSKPSAVGKIDGL